MKNTLMIKKNKTLKYVLKKGNYHISKYVVVHSILSKTNNNFFAICVSKKNGKSVDRNKLKRWAREIYKNEESKLKLGISVVILYRKTTTIKNLNYDIINNDIVKCFKELDLYEME